MPEATPRSGTQSHGRRGKTKLDPFMAALRQALEADAHRPKRDRRTRLRLFAEIQAQGYAGSYAQLAERIRRWHARIRQRKPHDSIVVDLGSAGLRRGWEVPPIAPVTKSACPRSSRVCPATGSMGGQR